MSILRLAFAFGAIIDAVALLPMLVPVFAKLLWGKKIGGFEEYFFAQGYRASLMLGCKKKKGWTLLLVWAYQAPLERRVVALLTA
jgi:hypothetical protein